MDKPSVMNPMPSLREITFDAPSKRSRNRCATSANVGNFIQHVFIVQLPERPWHCERLRGDEIVNKNEKGRENLLYSRDAYFSLQPANYISL